MALIHATSRTWTVDEYLRLFEQGILPQDERVELVEGEIVRMAAMGPRHKDAIIHANEALVLCFRSSHRVACQVDVRMGERSCPEPDFTIIRRDLPTDAALGQAELVIEVSDSTLNYDRCEKASLYARTGIPEYWIVNVDARSLEVHTQPVPDPSAIFGHNYASINVLPAEESASPLAAPTCRSLSKACGRPWWNRVRRCSRNPRASCRNP